MTVTLTILVFGFFAIFLLRQYLRRAIRLRSERRAALHAGERCPCGYPLADLDQARCPECGRVIHFDATAEELGLSKEELERAQRKRQERAARRANQRPI